MKTANQPEVNDAILESGELRTFLKKVHLLKYFSESDFQRLNHGRLTSVIRNVHYEGKIWDGSFQLIIEEDGSHTLHFKKCNVRIDIPDKVLGKKLSRRDKESLLAGEAIGPFKIGKHDMFFHVDRESNTISLYSAKIIGVPEEIMGYKISGKDRELLEEGSSIGPKVFSVNGHNFIGHFSIEERDGLYLWKMQYDKELTKYEAAELTKKYNESQGLNVSNAYGMTDIQKQIFFMPKDFGRPANLNKVSSTQNIDGAKIKMTSSKSEKQKKIEEERNFNSGIDNSHQHIASGMRGLFHDL
jgi:hypothetical protein